MREDLKSSIGHVLRSRRRSLGISQEQLAERAGVDRTYVSILERGLKSPTIETLGRICSVLGTLPEHVIQQARER
jgi:transcriptional regulator with XRE-family HTH domain